MLDNSNQGADSTKTVGKFSERLQAAIGDKVSVLAFAKRCGISDSLMRKYLRGSLPGTDNLVAIALNAHVSIAWLACGMGPMRDMCSSAPPPRDDEFVRIPVYRARCTQGVGPWHERCEVLYWPYFPRNMLIERITNLECVRGFLMAGDSMKGILEHGDIALLDKSRHDVTEEGIYAFCLNGQLTARRAQLKPCGDLVLLNSNPAYQTIVISREEVREIEIIGKIIWTGKWVY
ncbi:DNA polymerase V subunit UmuD [compost metagenome]